jgi:hypothetical protein
MYCMTLNVYTYAEAASVLKNFLKHTVFFKLLQGNEHNPV